MNKLLKEFKEFALKGNVIDLAVAVVIGTAFSKIVSSLVESIIMPIVGLLTGGTNFSYIKIHLYKEAYLGIGAFIQSVVDFAIIAACIFLFVKLLSIVKKQAPAEQPADPQPTKEELLLTEIRDILKEKNA